VVFRVEMEAIHSSETTYKTTWYDNPEDHHQHLHCHENLKSQITKWRYRKLNNDKIYYFNSSLCTIGIVK
jgi:Fe2+ or Zn2+ uptake regulation protein